MKRMTWVVLLVMVGTWLMGCGETFRGVGRDTSRVFYGAKTMFISQ